MAKVYYDLINAGYRTIEQVPLTWRAQTKALLDADNQTTTAEQTQSID